MIRRIVLLFGAFLLFSSAGCGLLSVLTLPFELLFSLIGGIVSGVGQGIDSIVQVEPIEGPAPWPEWRELPNGDTGVAFRNVQPGSRFQISFGVPGFERQDVIWPDDFPDAQRASGRVNVPLRLEPVARPVALELPR